jgi:hypothetical protein
VGREGEEGAWRMGQLIRGKNGKKARWGRRERTAGEGRATGG